MSSPEEPVDAEQVRRAVEKMTQLGEAAGRAAEALSRLVQALRERD